MSKVMNVRHAERNANFLTEKGEQYLEEAASYKRQGFESLASWYQGRGEGFISAASYIRTDIDIFGEEIAE
jgi:hypothetical protein